MPLSLVVVVIRRDFLPGPVSFTLARTRRGRPLTTTVTVAVPCCPAWVSRAFNGRFVGVDPLPPDAAAGAPDRVKEVVAPAVETSASCTPTAATIVARTAVSHR